MDSEHIDGVIELDDPDVYASDALAVYLATPLTNLSRRTSQKAARARAVLKSELSSCRAAFFDAYDPSEHTPPGSDHDPNDVYVTNVRETMRSDAIVILRMLASEGVGIEAQLACNASIPVILIYPRGGVVSRMMTGLPFAWLRQIEFDGLDDLRHQIRDALPQIAKPLANRRPERRREIQAARHASVGKLLMGRRISLGLRRLDVARMASVTPAWLRAIEMYPECVLSLTWQQTKPLGKVLGLNFSQSCDDSCILQVKEAGGTLHAVDAQSLSTLCEFVVSTDNKDELRINKLWETYREMRTQALAGRQPLDRPQTVKDWEKAYAIERGRLLI